MADGLIALLAATSAALSAGPLDQRTVSLGLANDLAGVAIATCRKAGRDAVVAVVDHGGNLVALQRGDAVGPHNALAAQRKAFTALSARSSTTSLALRGRILSIVA